MFLFLNSLCSNVPDIKCHKQKRHVLFFTHIKLVAHVPACAPAITYIKWRRLLSNAPRNHFFFVSQMKKNLSKTTTTKLYPAQKWETNTTQQGIQINLSLTMFTLLVHYNAKFVSCLYELNNL